MNPKYSIIIPTKDRYNAYLKICLMSLDLHTPKELFEVIIVDDSFAPDDKFFGYAQKNNIGAKMAKGEWLILMNDDVVVTPEWLENFNQFFSKFKEKDGAKLGIVGFSGLYFASYQSAFIGRRNYPFVSKRIIFALAAMKKSVFEDLGGFDNDWPVNNYTDDEICIKAVQKGYTNLVFPHYVFHFAGRSFSQEEYEKDLKAGAEYMEKSFGKDWRTLLE